MSYIPNDFHARFTACLARLDADEAFALKNIIEAAQASGTASGAGWDADLTKLEEIAGRGKGRLGKLFTEPTKRMLPMDMQARVDCTLGKLNRAGTPRELMLASAEGEALIRDLNAHVAIVKCLAAPKQMGLARD